MRKARKIRALVMALVMTFLMMQPAMNVQAATTTLNASTIVNYANSLAGTKNTSYAGACLRFCFSAIYKQLGATSACVGNGGACCAYIAGNKLLQSTSRNNIPLGSLVFLGGASSQSKCSCGNRYGHVGVYVGDDYIVSVRSSGAIKREKISDWVSWGYAYRGWGYAKNLNIVQDSADNMFPSIQNVKIVKRYKNGFTMQCFVSDNVGVAKVQFPTWESSKTSAGCTWYEGQHIGNGIWQFTFPDAMSEGYYTTHIYAWDTSGNYVCHGVDTYVDRTAPTISNVRVSDVTADGYKVSCTVTDNYAIDRVQFPTWTGYNGQDDILADWGTNAKARGTHCGNNVYEFYVKRSEHNSEFGAYATHIYAYDTSGNMVAADAGITNLENVAPTVSNVRVTNLAADGYTVVCTVTDDQSGVARVQFPTWTKSEWQDDLATDWINNSKCSGTYLGNNTYSFRVKRADHNNETGIYYTDIYAFDTLGNYCYGGGVSIEYKVALPKESSSDDKSSKAEDSAKTDKPVDAQKSDKENTSDSSTQSGDESESKKENVPTKIEKPEKNNSQAKSEPGEKSESVSKKVVKKGTKFTKSGIVYKITTKPSSRTPKVEVSGYSKSKSKVTIPDTVKYKGIKYKVTGIGSYALASAKKMTKITIGKNVTYIKTGAFKNCKKLKSVVINSKKITQVGKNAFYNTNKKLKVKVPKMSYKKYKKLFKNKGNKRLSVKK